MYVCYSKCIKSKTFCINNKEIKLIKLPNQYCIHLYMYISLNYYVNRGKEISCACSQQIYFLIFLRKTGFIWMD